MTTDIFHDLLMHYQNTIVDISKSWLLRTLENKINTMDCKSVKADVNKFIPNELSRSIHSWDSDILLGLVKNLDKSLA